MRVLFMATAAALVAASPAAIPSPADCSASPCNLFPEASVTERYKPWGEIQTRVNGNVTIPFCRIPFPGAISTAFAVPGYGFDPPLGPTTAFGEFNLHVYNEFRAPSLCCEYNCDPLCSRCAASTDGYSPTNEACETCYGTETGVGTAGASDPLNCAWCAGTNTALTKDAIRPIVPPPPPGGDYDNNVYVQIDGTATMQSVSSLITDPLLVLFPASGATTLTPTVAPTNAPTPPPTPVIGERTEVSESVINSELAAYTGGVALRSETYATITAPFNPADDCMPYGVLTPLTDDDMATALQFLSGQGDDGLDYVVRAGGYNPHDSCNGWVLDVSAFKTIAIDSQPLQQSTRNPATISVGAGVTWGEVADLLDTDTMYGGKYYVAGSWHAESSVVATVMAGGYGPFTAQHGLVCQQAIEFTLVTPAGTIVEVERDDDFANGDLFWALCGGGGANYGVVTSVTLELFALENKLVHHQVTGTSQDWLEDVLDEIEKNNIYSRVSAVVKVEPDGDDNVVTVDILYNGPLFLSRCRRVLDRSGRGRRPRWKWECPPPSYFVPLLPPCRVMYGCVLIVSIFCVLM